MRRCVGTDPKNSINLLSKARLLGMPRFDQWFVLIQRNIATMSTAAKSYAHSYISKSPDRLTGEQTCAMRRPHSVRPHQYGDFDFNAPGLTHEEVHAKS